MSKKYWRPKYHNHHREVGLSNVTTSKISFRAANKFIVGKMSYKPICTYILVHVYIFLFMDIGIYILKVCRK